MPGAGPARSAAAIALGSSPALRVGRMAPQPPTQDRLVAAGVQMADAGAWPVEPVIEAFADGWWYTARFANRRRLAACVTDADIARRLRLETTEGWLAAPNQTQFASALVRWETELSPPLLVTATTDQSVTRLARPRVSIRPCAHGLFKALRSGVFAAYAIGHRLLGRNQLGLRRYSTWLARELEAYRSALSGRYREETCWPDRPFWHRRHAAAGRAAVASVTQLPCLMEQGCVRSCLIEGVTT